MYPGPTGAPENHKRGCRSDGVKSKPPDNTSSNYLPHLAQPNGIFSGGTSFNPQAFLSAVREIYEKVVMGTGAEMGLEMEIVCSMR
jgi:predicted lipid-binding transport protein (Tim44 family)